MSDLTATPTTLRILPPDTDAPPADQTMEPVEIKEKESDTGELLHDVLEGRHVYDWPEGAVVGDGTPGPGRRPLDIDERIIKAMAMVGGTNKEIAEFLGCSESLLKRRFGDVLRGSRSGRKIRLRQAQHQLALSGNATMLIWLGKQELGQVDESRIRLGDLSRFSNEDLEQIAQGKIPGQITAGSKDEDKKE